MSLEVSAGQIKLDQKISSVVPKWLVYEEFARQSQAKEVSVQHRNNSGSVAVQQQLLDNRVLHINYPNGGVDRSWRVSVLELADASMRWTTRTEWPEGVKRENYVYDRDRFNFAVMMSDGASIYNLPIENASSQHIGAIDLRGINGKYRPENETISITAFLEGLRCNITFNRVSGDGIVAFSQPKGSQTQGWILGIADSKNIHKFYEQPTTIKIPSGVGATAIDAYNLTT